MLEVEATGQRGGMAMWPPDVAKTSFRLKNLRRQYLANQAR